MNAKTAKPVIRWDLERKRWYQSKLDDGYQLGHRGLLVKKCKRCSTIKIILWGNICSDCEEVLGNLREDCRLLQINAHQSVRYAIREGTLPDLKYVETKCSDCDKRANVYDHRDYNKPLEVSPVCFSCNCRRGPNLNTEPFSKRPRKKSLGA